MDCSDTLSNIIKFTDNPRTFKYIRVVSRLFRKVADGVLFVGRWYSVGVPGDIYFADKWATIAKKYNLVSNLCDAAVLDVRVSKPINIHLATNLTINYLDRMNLKDFDKLASMKNASYGSNGRQNVRYTVYTIDYKDTFIASETFEMMLPRFMNEIHDFPPLLSFAARHFTKGNSLFHHIEGNKTKTFYSGKAMISENTALALQHMRDAGQMTYHDGMLSSNQNITKEFYEWHQYYSLYPPLLQKYVEQVLIGDMYTLREMMKDEDGDEDGDRHDPATVDDTSEEEENAPRYKLDPAIVAVNPAIDFEYASNLHINALFRMDVPWDFLVKNIKLAASVIPIGIPYCARTPERWAMICKMMNTESDLCVSWKDFDPEIHKFEPTYKRLCTWVEL